MRYLLNIFRKNSKPIPEQLEYIKECVKEIEEKRKLNLSNEKHIIGSLMLYSFMIYFSCTAFMIIYVKPSKTDYWPLYFAPLVAFPFLIFYIKKIIHWFYIRRLSYVDKKLLDLKKKLKELLKDVIEKETYKRANELLNKFDPDYEFRNEYENNPDRKSKTQTDHNSDTELDKKNLMKRPKNISENIKAVSVSDLRQHVSHKSKSTASPEIKLIRPLLNQNRSSFDKFIDFVVGDGFDHRYALICKHCSSHNGMALAEEFPFLGFKCAYCVGYNAPRQIKPDPPIIYGARSSGTAHKESLRHNRRDSAMKSCIEDVEKDVDQKSDAEFTVVRRSNVSGDGAAIC